MGKKKTYNLQTVLAQDGIGAVSSPTAQTNKLLQFRWPVIPGTGLTYDRFMANPMLADVDRAVIELLFLYGLRITEVLRIDHHSITPHGHIMVKGAKGSHDRIVIPVEYGWWWQGQARSIMPIERYFSRWYFYRKFKKLGISYKGQRKDTFSVTHAFRHALISEFRRVGMDESQMAKFVGHVSKQNTLNYGR